MQGNPLTSSRPHRRMPEVPNDLCNYRPDFRHCRRRSDPGLYAPYFSVALMAGLDTAFGGLRAAMEGDYDNLVFISGFVVNILLSVFFCYAGIKMDIDFYLIVILVLGMRIFNNLAIIRRLYLKK